MQFLPNGYQVLTFYAQWYAQELFYLQLFNSFDSFAYVQDYATVNPNNATIPYNTFNENIFAPQPVTNSVIWTKEGGLIWFDTLNGEYHLNCKEYPYRSLIEALKTFPIHVNMIRLNGWQGLQKQSFKVFKKDIFGKLDEKPIFPDKYISPVQVQPVIEIPVNITIDGFTGFSFEIGDTQQDNLTVEIHAKMLRPNYEK